MKPKNAAREAAMKNATVEARVIPAKRVIEIKGVTVEFLAPKEALDLLPTPEGVQQIKCACLSSECMIDERRAQWDEPHLAGLKVAPPMKYYLKLMMGRPMNSLIKVFFKSEEWERIQRLADQLGITPAQWLLAGAGYAIHRDLEAALRDYMADVRQLEGGNAA